LMQMLGISLQTFNQGLKMGFSLAIPDSLNLKSARVLIEDGEEGWQILGKREYAFEGKGSPLSGEFEAKWKGKYFPLGGTIGSVIATLRFSSERALRIKEKWLIDCSYVQAFRLFGVYDNTNNQGMERAYPPEEWIGKGIPSQIEGAEEKRSNWQVPKFDLATSSAPVYIDLLSHFGRVNNGVAYAFTYVYLPKEIDAQILVGSDDGCVLWINGQKVHAYLSPRVARPDEDRIPVHLRKGWNELVLKVGQVGGDWGFYLRILGKDGKPIQGLLNWYEAM